jgi:hypothetical protein
MTHACYVFVSEPAELTYAELVRFCCSVSASMILVVRDPEIDPGPLIQNRLARLQPFFVTSSRSMSWPGTQLLADEATVYRHRIAPGLESEMLVLASRLFEWVHPDAPEDPCFLRGDDSPVLVTISHERDAYLLLTRQENEILHSRFKTLASIVRPEP